MRARLSVALLLAVAVILPSQGCVSTVFRPSSDLNAIACPPVEPSSVRVLSRPPQESFTVLGEVEAYVTGYYSYEDVLSRLRAIAAQKGANAIFFVRDVSMMAPEYWNQISDSAWRKRSSLVYKAVLLTDVPEPCPGAPPPNPGMQRTRYARR